MLRRRNEDQRSQAASVVRLAVKIAAARAGCGPRGRRSALSPCAVRDGAAKADLVLHEGRDSRAIRDSDSVAVAGGRIIALAPFGELKSLVGPRTHLIRLAGRTRRAGLHRLRICISSKPRRRQRAGLWRCRTIDDLLADLRVAAGRTPPGNWLRAFGCDEALLAGRRGPTRAELDQAVPKNPLRLRHQTLHASWLNSRAIAAWVSRRQTSAARRRRDDARRDRPALTGLVVGMEAMAFAPAAAGHRSRDSRRAREPCSRELAPPE